MLFSDSRLRRGLESSYRATRFRTLEKVLWSSVGAYMVFNEHEVAFGVDEIPSRLSRGQVASDGFLTLTRMDRNLLGLYELFPHPTRAL